MSYTEKRMKIFASSAGVLSFETMSETELDYCFLARFYAGLRMENGSCYINKSVQGISYSQRQHFLPVRGI